MDEFRERQMWPLNSLEEKTRFIRRFGECAFKLEIEQRERKRQMDRVDCMRNIEDQMIEKGIDPFAPERRLEIVSLANQLYDQKLIQQAKEKELEGANKPPVIPRSSMSNAEKADFIEKHGTDAYQALPA